MQQQSEPVNKHMKIFVYKTEFQCMSFSDFNSPIHAYIHIYMCVCVCVCVGEYVDSKHKYNHVSKAFIPNKKISEQLKTKGYL